MNKLIKTIGIIICLYILQFFVIPFLFPSYFPISNEAYVIFVLTAIVLLNLGFYLVNNKITHWLISDIIYSLLIILRHSNGLYGIGYARISLDGLQLLYSQKHAVVGSIVATVVIVMIQLIIKGTTIAYEKIKDYKKQHN